MTAPGAEQARENSEYLRRLLNEKQPEILALLQAAERQVDLELSRECRDRRRAVRRDQTSVDDESGGAVSPSRPERVPTANHARKMITRPFRRGADHRPQARQPAEHGLDVLRIVLSASPAEAGASPNVKRGSPAGCAYLAVMLIVVFALDGRRALIIEGTRARGRTGGCKPKLNSRQAATVRRMYEAVGPDGKRQHTVAEIAEAVGVHRTTVYDYLSKEG